ncbi:hypothetical protein LTR64_000246 [Lithohypha guttulata]|uniref:uncharacterized protein n=1 Tax=Lithohypha guttulata TaxID=1690604 RepID=UPI002DDFF5E2|nr:hypothetical protein LTR51_007608 [Lithohypha guttulata]
MNHWSNDSYSTLNGHATLSSIPNSPMSFPQPAQTINPAHFQNQSFLNGAARTASPAFHQQSMYQTNQVIPSKRSREDSLGTSPRPSHNGLPAPASRSHTPGGPFPGFHPQSNGAPSFTSAPTAFQHLQTANNATPSPTMQQIGFPQNATAQRMSTASPSPFSPQHNMSGASPGTSDRASRVATPHDVPPNFMQNPSSHPGLNPQQFGQNMMSQVGMNQMNLGQIPQMQAYQQQLQRLAAQNVTNGMSPAHTNGSMMQQNGTSQSRMSSTPQDFFRGLQQFSAAKGRPIDLRPHICGRQIDALRVYQIIMKGGGSSRITKLGQWLQVAQSMQMFPPQQIQPAAVELQQYWLSNVGAYEQMWIQQRQRQAQMQSPTRDGPPQNTMNNHQRAPSDLMPRQLNGPTSHTNGLVSIKDPNDSTSAHQRQSLSRQPEQLQLDEVQDDLHLEPTPKRPSPAATIEPEPESTMPMRKPIEDPFVPEILQPSRHHGPIDLEETFMLGQELVQLKPTVPSLRELGVIDIHALIMAIKSGIHAETRNALDTLITLSSEPSLQIQLKECDDLIDTLVDCAQVELDFLNEYSTEVSEEISLQSYEELVRSSHVDTKTIQSIPEFGSLEYDLDRAVDRLICVTTLIRNFSFYEPNFVVLGEPTVLQLATRVIQYIGTKDMPLRSPRNTLDFMKDIIIYLSNLSQSLVIPTKQDALCLLHFLLSFAPNPPPVSSNNERIAFTPYTPAIHKYLPPAVDSIAKLLARDEPNRVYFRAIFHADARAAVPYELLTRTFGLVVAPIPHTTAHLRAQVEARRAFLLQGLLAAEIIASLAPGSEIPLARSWLQSEDCWAGNALKMASALSALSSSNSRHRDNRNLAQQRGGIVVDEDPMAHGSIVNRAMATLRTLANKSRTTDEDGNTSVRGVPTTAIMKRENLLGAMVQKDIDPAMLRLFCQYAGIED